MKGGVFYFYECSNLKIKNSEFKDSTIIEEVDFLIEGFYIYTYNM